MERGQKLNEIEDRTELMANEAKVMCFFYYFFKLRNNEQSFEVSKGEFFLN